MSERKRVMFVLPSLFGGGAERVILHLVNHLDRDRFEPLLALGAKTGPYLKDLRPDVRVVSLDAVRARRAIPALLRAVRAHRPQTVLATLGMTFALAAVRPFLPRGTRVLLREGNSVVAFLQDVARTSPLRAGLMGRAYRQLYSRADQIICQCDFMLRDVRDNLGLPAAKLVRIYNPVDVGRVQRLAGEGAANLPEGGPRLVTVGRLEYQKGYDILLAAFSRVRARYPDATLTVLGDGPDLDALQAQAGALRLSDAVRWQGFQSNPYAYLQAADLFVSSSRYEGFANVILEAMACGTPVVATDCPGGNREVVEEGVSGWLAPVEPGSLGETLCQALAELPRMDRSRIRSRCAERFAVEKIVSEYQDCF